MQLLRLEELAIRLGISYTQARVLVLYDEVIPHVTVGARGIRVKEDELEKYIAGLEKKGGVNGNQDSGEYPDTRRPFEGRRVLPADSGRDRAPGIKQEDS